MRVKGEVPPDEIYQAAVEAFDRADALFAPGVMSQLQKARLLAVWPGHEEEAKATFRAAVEGTLELGEPSLSVGAAEAAASYGRSIQDAEFQRWALEKGIEADPSRVGAWVALARLEERAGGSGEVRLERLIETRPDDIAA